MTALPRPLAPKPDHHRLGRLRSGLIALALLWPLAATAAPGELVWQDFADLPEGERYFAQTALYEMWGSDPDLWPDWIEPAAVRVAAGRGESILIVRQPLRLACGEYGFSVLGPVTADLTRQPLGGRFCGGVLSVVPVSGRAIPDLVVEQTYEADADGRARPLPPKRWRWLGEGWGEIQAR